MKEKKKRKATPEPRGERLMIAGNWKDAIKKAFKKEKPASGWPKPDPRRKPR
jgi:hypothetical protein